MTSQPAFSFFVCPDPALARSHAEKIFTDVKSASQKTQWKTHIFWADEPLDAFWKIFETDDLLSQPKRILLRHSHLLPADTWKKISLLLSRLRPWIWPAFFLEVPFEKGQPKIPAHIVKLKCWEFAKRHQWIWLHPGLDKRTLPAYLRASEKFRALDFDKTLMADIAEVFSPDAASIANDLEKLLLYASSQPVTRTTLKIIKNDFQLDIFSLIRAIQEKKNFHLLWKTLLSEQLAGETSFFSFLSLLARETRSLWQLLHDETAAFPPSILPQKKILAQRLTVSSLVLLWEALYLAERKVKTGEASPEQWMEYLMASLANIFS